MHGSLEVKESLAKAKLGPFVLDMAFTRYCHEQYCMLNGKTEGAGGNHMLRNFFCNIQTGGGCNKRGVECQE